MPPVKKKEEAKKPAAKPKEEPKAAPKVELKLVPPPASKVDVKPAPAPPPAPPRVEPVATHACAKCGKMVAAYGTVDSNTGKGYCSILCYSKKNG